MKFMRNLAHEEALPIFEPSSSQPNRATNSCMLSQFPQLAATLLDQIHPSHEVLAVNTAAKACLVTYMYTAAHTMALASMSSKTTFDP